MKLLYFLLASIVLISAAEAAPRQRVTSVVVNVDRDPSVCSDSNDGITAPVCSIQRGLDIGAGDFDCAPPFTWTPAYYIGERYCVTVQLAPASCTMPHVLSVQSFLSGSGISGPILLRGDPSNPSSVCVRADAAGLQGITSQNGARLIIDGIAIFGASYTTLINCLSGGQIVVRNVWFGPSTSGGPTAPMGAAGCQLEVAGTVSFWGGGFAAVLTGIEQGKIILAPNAVFNFLNAMNFGQMIGLQGAQLWTQGNPPAFTGQAWASSGRKFSATDASFMGIYDALNNVPGSGYTLGTASTAYSSVGPLPANTSGP